MPEAPTKFEGSAEKLHELQEARKRLEALQRRAGLQRAGRYRNDPVGFVKEVLRATPSEYQERILNEIVKQRKVAVRGPHGLGKTCLASWVVLWLAVTRDAVGVDWKGITTASAWRQLTDYLWPEIHKWSGKVDWEKIGREPFDAVELLKLGLRLKNGSATAAACTDPQKIEGAHADCLLYLYDEAKAIPAQTFDASEGAFSGAGEDTGREAFALAISTPGAPAGRFFDIHARVEGLESWFPIHITLEDAVAAGRVSAEWAEEKRRLWGEDSSIFRNRVLGEFASEEDGVVPYEHVAQAMDRWHRVQRGPGWGDLTTIAVDVGGESSSADKTKIALRHERGIKEVRTFEGKNTMEVAGFVKAIYDAHIHPAKSIQVIVDVIGIGAGVVSRLREQGISVQAFDARAKTSFRDRSNELQFFNARAAALWHVREVLDPDYEDVVPIPQTDRLMGDLTSPKWKMTSGGKILVESKEEIKKRLGRSPDDGDAVMMACWVDAVTSVDNFRRSKFTLFASKPRPSRWAMS